MSTQSKDGAHIRVHRYSGSARINHWIVAISFVLLMISGLALLALRLEMPRAFTPSAGSTLVPRDLHMRFLKEARAGAPLLMHGGVLELGKDQLLACLDMRHADGAPSIEAIASC